MYGSPGVLVTDGITYT